MGYRVNTQNTEWVIRKTHRIQSGLFGKHTEYRVGYSENTQNTEWVIKHTEYRVGYWVNTQNTEWVIG